MTCMVKDCNNPDIRTFKVVMTMEKTGLDETHDVRCCSEHEKAFEALYGKKDRFVN